ncbi:alpha/beta hydrolase [Candidimonas sp. SYP-B2681]|uniref:dienelactone hydrolase family protein n=1 Tax=Candidimonas sp. SYP-B2681 TaxID=2497686 RepID=UPI000F8973FE|nr:alpha/beta family hydrolase [Candidimonas sp. SYP-B2681]RTZ47675.1 alpha/beta hydrolase [Candidimonas sp. SYP-B2681]
MQSLQNELISIKVDDVHLEGLLEVPQAPLGMILFAHGSGSGRLSPRNNAVAQQLRRAHFGTLLLDLLTLQEDKSRSSRFDIDLLTRRLNAASDWLRHNAITAALPLGLFGASTGAAAALQVAAERGTDVAAVVSRGGRPDMARRQFLAAVSAPTLLVVGGDDESVIKLNRVAYAELTCIKRLEIVPGATHLFEEPGTLEKVSALAVAWFSEHLPQQG